MARIGRQTPTQSVVLPYEKTIGREAVKLYSLLGKIAQEWQELLLYDIMAVNAAGLWVHTKFGYSLPRRNGKSEILTMRELWGLINGEHIMHTAHRTTTTHASWEKLIGWIEKLGLEYRSIRAVGREMIELTDTGGRIEYRTRTSKSGLGEGFDLLVIDEAQEYTDDQESALKYIVTDSKNPQTILCGTPPTPTSTGTVFTELRKNTLKGECPDAGWEEWSVDEKTLTSDKEAWYETNPSLGTIFTERSVMDEIGSDPIDFNIQRLGLWIRYSLKSAITETEWNMLECDSTPKLHGKIYAGVKFSKTDTVSLSVAVRTEDKIFLEAIDCRPIRNGLDWIIQFLRSVDYESVVADGAGGQQILESEMKDCGMRKPILPTVREVITANATFEKGIYDQTICHGKQPSLLQAAGNCEKRAIGSGGGFGYRSIKDGVDISLLDSAILAYWICSISKDKKKQTISY
jgi:phage terminase large subunit-like protein